MSHVIRKISFYFGLVLIACLVILIILAVEQDSSPPPFVQRSAAVNSNRVVFVSDSQDPIWIETLFLKQKNNIQAKEMVFSEILKLSPSAVFHLGDLVAFGFWKTEWIPIDNFTSFLKKQGIEFYPILGNHELFFPAQLGLRNFVKRFPFHSETGYSVRKGNVGYILLNSNFGSLSSMEMLEQENLFRETLLKFDKDPQIDFVIVATHHSPFTNSKIVGVNEEVQKLFVPRFINSSKAKVFISGHAHAFEHFKREGKDFLVIGGGGGLQQPLFKGEDEKHKDLFDSVSTKRMFHFLQINNLKDSLTLEVMMLNEEFSLFKNVYSITIKK